MSGIYQWIFGPPSLLPENMEELSSNLTSAEAVTHLREKMNHSDDLSYRILHIVDDWLNTHPAENATEEDSIASLRVALLLDNNPAAKELLQKLTTVAQRHFLDETPAMHKARLEVLPAAYALKSHHIARWIIGEAAKRLKETQKSEFLGNLAGHERLVYQLLDQEWDEDAKNLLELFGRKKYDQPEGPLVEFFFHGPIRQIYFEPRFRNITETALKKHCFETAKQAHADLVSFGWNFFVTGSQPSHAARHLLHSALTRPDGSEQEVATIVDALWNESGSDFNVLCDLASSTDRHGNNAIMIALANKKTGSAALLARAAIKSISGAMTAAQSEKTQDSEEILASCKFWCEKIFLAANDEEQSVFDLLQDPLLSEVDTLMDQLGIE